MRSMINKIREWTFWEKLLLVFLAVQVLLVVVSNLTLIGDSLDCDKGLTARQAVEFWRNGTLLMKDWTYQTTLEIDCSTLLAIPLYGMTKNVFLSYGIANIIYLLLLFYVLAFLFSKERPAYFLLSAGMICIPYEIGMLDYYDTFLFGIAWYNLRILLPILLAGLLLRLERDKKADRRTIALVAVYILLMFLTSVSSGIYVTVTGILPITAVYLFWKLVKNPSQNEIMPKMAILILLVPLVVVPVGLYLNRLYMGGGSREQTMFLCGSYEMQTNLSYAFWGMFELFGGLMPSLETPPVLSMMGIKYICKFILVLIFLVCAIKVVALFVKDGIPMEEGEKNRLLLKGMLVSVFLWNFFILIVTKNRAGSATSEYRYHLIGMVPLLILTVILVLDKFRLLQEKAGNFMKIAVAVFVMVISVASWRHLFTREELCVPLKEFCAYCSENQYDYIYMYYESDNANICRAIDTDRVYLFVSDEGRTYDYLFYEKYIDAPMETENSILAVDREIADFGDAFNLGEFTAKYVGDAGTRKMYQISKSN